MYKKPDWMPIEDWQKMRVETMKENIRACGDTIETQKTSIEYFKVKCSSQYCERTFYEFEALKYCPHCTAVIDSQNVGQPIAFDLHIDTRTGKITINKV